MKVEVVWTDQGLELKRAKLEIGRIDEDDYGEGQDLTMKRMILPSQDGRPELAAKIEAEFGIPKDAQEWSIGGEALAPTEAVVYARLDGAVLTVSEAC